MNSDIAISVKNVSKTFRIPHEKITSLRGAAIAGVKRSNFGRFLSASKGSTLGGGKTYEEFQALDDVSFEVKKGEFFGIIGRNGSGKSTLLKILSGIYQPDCGKIHINGRISPFLELGIGFNPELSGRDNIYLNATVLGLSKKQIDKKFDEIVEFSELSRFIDQKLKNYSSGMQVRLAFSVAIHANRDILLMDEVLAVGDTNFQYKCLSEFTKYRNLGKTVILVTHDMLTAQKYCDRLMLMRNGNVSMIGNPQKVGNEYIYQNMDDEERRIREIKKTSKRREVEVSTNTESAKEKNKITPQRTINGAPVLEKFSKIKKITISNQNNEEKNVFKRGDEIIISTSILFLERVENPNFGLIIKNSENRPIFITNTDFNKIKTGIFEKETVVVDYVFRNFLSNGDYSITVALANSIAACIYDWIDNAGKFIVIGNYESGGLVDFEHEIRINRIKPKDNQ